MGWFIVKAGPHRVGGKTYKQGDKFFVENDKSITRFNGGPGSVKFEPTNAPRGYGDDGKKLGEKKSEESEVVSPEPESVEDFAEQDLEQYNSMTVAELKAYAKENNIDIGGAERKSDIIAAIIDASAE